MDWAYIMDSQYMRWLSKTLFYLSIMTSVSAFSATLKQEIRTTLATNPVFYAELANEQATYHAVKEAKGGLFPQVSIFAAGGRETSVSPAVRAFMVDRITLNRDEFFISLSQLLFDGGKITNEIRSLKYSNEAAKFDVLRIRDGLVLQTAEQYLNVLRFRERTKLAEMNVRIHKGILDKVKLRFKGGAGRRGEVALAESRLARAQAELAATRGELDTQEMRYYTVTGHFPPENMILPSQPVKWLPKTINKGLKFSLEHNPELFVAKSKVLSREANEKSVRGRFFPTVNFEVSATENDNIDGIEGGNRDVLGLVTLRYELFRGGSDLESYRIARSEKQRTIKEAESIRRNVFESLRIAWVTYKSTIDQIKYLKENIKAETVVVQDYKIQFKLGTRPLFNVLDAENDLFIAKTALVNARYNHAIAYYRILQSQGNVTKAILGV